VVEARRKPDAGVQALAPVVIDEGMPRISRPRQQIRHKLLEKPAAALVLSDVGVLRQAHPEPSTTYVVLVKEDLHAREWPGAVSQPPQVIGVPIVRERLQEAPSMAPLFALGEFRPRVQLRPAFSCVEGHSLRSCYLTLSRRMASNATAVRCDIVIYDPLQHRERDAAAGKHRAVEVLQVEAIPERGLGTFT
jgi:hypothetical protein